MLSGSSCPCEEDSEFPGLSLPSACWLFKTMGSSCELVKLWNVTKDAAQSQMAPISPSNANKVSWKEGRLTHTTMHRMIYINNICTAAGTFAHKSSHTPSTATIHFPYRYTHHLYINMFILTENMQTNNWRVPSVLWDISSCSLTLGLINIHKRACPQKCSKLTSFTGKHTVLHLHHPQTIYRWKSPDLHPHLERRTEYHAFSHICGVIANIRSMTRKMKRFHSDRIISSLILVDHVCSCYFSTCVSSFWVCFIITPSCDAPVVLVGFLEVTLVPLFSSSSSSVLCPLKRPKSETNLSIYERSDIRLSDSTTFY